MELPLELTESIKKKKFGDVEAAWMARAEETPGDIEWFLLVARDVARAGDKDRAASLLALLAGTLRERGDWHNVLAVLRAASGHAPERADLRTEMIAALRELYPGQRSFDALVAKSRLADDAPPVEAATRLERWLPYDAGEFFDLKGKGLVRVIDLNPDLEKVRVALSPRGELAFRLDEARKVLTPLSHQHFLVRKATDPAALRALAESDPPALLEHLFESFRRALSGKEIRDHLEAVVPGGWTRWWGRVKEHPRLLASGSGARLSYHWSASADDAESHIRSEFDRAPLERKLELARRHGGRGVALDRHLAGSLARSAQAANASAPALAMEAFLFIEDLFPGVELPAHLPAPRDAVERLLHAGDPGELVVALGDASLQRTALGAIKKLHAGTWIEVFASVFRRSDEPKTLDFVYDELARSSAPDVAVSLIDAVFASPRRYPRQFLWVFQQALKNEELRHRLDPGGVRKVLEAYRQEEFRPFRPKILTLVDQTGFLEQPLERATELEARHLLTIIDGDCGLTPQRRESLRTTLLARFPQLGKKDETFMVTPESMVAKRAEYRRLTEVEMPRNSADIGRAAALGDLSENSEYKSAREKQLLLMSQVSGLDDELTRAREIDPAAVPIDRVGVGSRVTLRRLDGGEPMEITILGPWDSDPDHHVVSYLTPLGEDFMNLKVGDGINVWGHDYEIAGLAPWMEAGRDG